MKRLAPIIVLLLLLAVAAGVILFLVRAKQKHNAEMTEFYLCETNFKDGQYQKAVQLLDTFIKAHPKSEKGADAYYYLASSLEKLEDRTRSMPAWNKLLESYPEGANRAEAYYYLGVGYQDMNQYAKALENYNTVVNRFSNMPVAAGAWYNMGRIYEIQGQESGAINAYQSVLEKHPGTEFAADAERRQGVISLKRFLRENTSTYEVKRGDSLVRIAARYNVTPDLLKRINGFTSNMLQRGQIIRVIDAKFNILVDLSAYRLTLKSGDKTVKKYIVSVGKAETPTPPGDYKVTDKLPNPVWYCTLPSGAKEAIQPDDPRNELGTRWIGFKPAYGIHGTIAPESIGQAVSNGCVRMLNEDVEELYDLVGVGTPVKIVAGMN